MSWLARSIANSLRIDDDDENQPLPPANFPATSPEYDDLEEREGGPDSHGRMKEDFTEFRETLTRQLRGVANFLAPPPESDHRVISEWNRSESPDPSVSGDDHDDSSVNARISTAPSDDHSEIGVFMNRVVAENYQGSSSFNSFGLQNIDCVVDEEDDYDDNDDDDDVEDWINEAAGLTDEVLTFAGNIAHHPETWLDFPVEDDEDLDDFPMSESQRRHAQAIEHLTPRLAALRIELCPAHMSEGFFWKVYYVLLHSRLNKHDAELLLTPEVVEARAKWMQELHKRDKKESEQYHVGRYPRQSADLDEDFTPRSLQNEHSETLSSWTFPSEAATSSTTAEADSDYEKQLVSTEMQFTNKSNNTNEEKLLAHTDDKNTGTAPVSKRLVLNFDDDDDDWPEDDCSGKNVTIIPVGIEDEVSFSDLEDDDCCIPVKSKSEVRV